jgi:DNA (cytosine-5)-methyltransferase 1
VNVLDLFSGIGGFSLGLERAGMRTVAFCEIDPYCRAVLAKHWPAVRCYTDIRELTATRLVADVWHRIEVICGGFPCQDISVAGKGAGLAGERSGLWSEYARLIREIRPRYAIVENVSGLLGRGLEQVLGDLASIGYDTEWHCIPAAYVGAPHRRDRIWIVAYPSSERRGVRDTKPSKRQIPKFRIGHGQAAMADTDEPRFSLAWPQPDGADGREARGSAASSGWWAAEPDVGRMAHGIPARAHRLRALGNSVVPQIPEMIGRAIMQHVTSVCKHSDR